MHVRGPARAHWQQGVDDWTVACAVGARWADDCGRLMSFLRKWVEWCWNNDFQMENLVQRFKELTLYGYASASDPRVPLVRSLSLTRLARFLDPAAAGGALSPLTPTLQQLGQDSSAEDLAFLTSYLTQNNLTASERMIQAVRLT